MGKKEKNMEERENAGETVIPAPADIACEGCRHGIEQERSLGRGLEVWWYCRLLFGWVWDGSLERGYPRKCSAREQSEE
jgi:hypothetical protein